MGESVSFLSMFSEYMPPEALKCVLSQAVICAADIDSVGRKLTVQLHSPNYIQKRQLDEVIEQIKAIYHIHQLELNPTYPQDQLACIEHEDLMQLFVEEDSMCRGILAGAQWLWEDNCLVISLKANGKQELEKCVAQVCRKLNRQFNTQVSVDIRVGAQLDGQALFDQMQKMRSDILSRLPKTPVSQSKEPAAQQKTEAIYGKPFKTKPQKMSDITLDMGSVVVEGRVFAIDHKELTKRNAWIISFDITDHTGSVRVKRFLEQNEAKPIVESIAIGKVVKVQGIMTVDKFDGETVLNPYAIVPGVMQKREDTAEGGKRVELHLHTNMSNMDALTDTQTAIRQAAAWGHKAIAITDHGCVQSFTDALHAYEDKKPPIVAGTEQKIKILYGCEGYYINDVDDHIAVVGNQNLSLDGEYVAFDFETTGLYARRDKIIEIGAVRMKNGREIARFQTFVDPEQHLEKRTIDLTGITDDMLKGAPKLAQALPKFLEFINGSVLVAHNADFDRTFLQHACNQVGCDYNLTTVDTLTIAQNLLPNLGKYTLDTVAKHFELMDFQHHRAGDDALICGKIMEKLVELLKQRGITDIQQINDEIAPLRSAFRQQGVRCQHIVLFAKNQLGLRNLYRLISESNLHYFKKFPRIFKIGRAHV